MGDGSSINLWKDPWIPRSGSRHPITPRGNMLLDKVSDLIDPSSGQWDEEMIKKCMWAVDAKQILQIALVQDREDTWAWHYDPKGMFSVKSAYKVYQMLDEPKGSSSGGTTSHQVSKFSWNTIWSAPCPPNVRQFLWRIAHDSLPHRASIVILYAKYDSGWTTTEPIVS